MPHSFHHAPLHAARFAVSLCLVMLTGLPSRADSQDFDPIVFTAMMKIQQDWAPGTVAAPDGTLHFFRDSLYNYERVVGFTHVTRDTAADGWSVALDYDADRFGSLKLSRIRGVKRIDAADTSAAFGALLHRIESVLEKRIMNRRRVSSAHVEWIWTPRAGYLLAARLATDARGTILLLFDLHHGN